VVFWKHPDLIGLQPGTAVPSLGDRRPLVFQLGGYSAPFGISLVGDLLSATMVVMSQIVLSAGILYALDSKDQVTQYPLFTLSS
jgi:formate hydrogenlyase subunit 3/multisubunit Na+/H+ antiporter MnhD subunit